MKESMNPDPKKPFLLGALENAEAATDLLLKNEALKAVPFVATAVKLLEGANDIRSNLLRAKILKFVSDPSLRQSVDSGRMRLRLASNDDYAESIGETLFMVLDRVTDMNKPVLLAKVFALYLAEGIDAPALKLLMHAIDSTSITDLEKFIRLRQPSGDESDGWQARLAATGLLSGVIMTPMGGGFIDYFISPYGESLLRAIDQ